MGEATSETTRTTPLFTLPITIQDARNIVTKTFGAYMTRTNPPDSAWTPPETQNGAGLDPRVHKEWLLKKDARSLRARLESQCEQVYDENIRKVFSTILDAVSQALTERYGQDVALFAVQKMLLAAEFLLFSINYPFPYHDIELSEEERSRPLGVIATTDAFMICILTAAIREITEVEGDPPQILGEVYAILEEIGSPLDVQGLVVDIQRALSTRRYLEARQRPLIENHLEKYYFRQPSQQEPEEYFHPAHIFSTHLDLTGQQGDCIAQCSLKLHKQHTAGLALLVDQIASLALYIREFGVEKPKPIINGSILQVVNYKDALFQAYLALPMMILTEYMFDYGVIYFKLGGQYLQIVSPGDYISALNTSGTALAMRIIDKETAPGTLTLDRDRLILTLGDAESLRSGLQARLSERLTQDTSGASVRIGVGRPKSPFSLIRKGITHPMIESMVARMNKQLADIEQEIVRLGITWQLDLQTSLPELAQFAREHGHAQLEMLAMQAYNEDRAIVQSDLQGREPVTEAWLAEYVAHEGNLQKNRIFDIEGVTLIVDGIPAELPELAETITTILQEDFGFLVIRRGAWNDPYYHALHFIVAYPIPGTDEYLRVLEIKIVPSEEAVVSGADHLIYNQSHKYLFYSQHTHTPVLFAAAANREMTLKDRVELGEHLGDQLQIEVTGNEGNLVQLYRISYEFDLFSKTLSGATAADILVLEAQRRGLSSGQIIHLLIHQPIITVQGKQLQRRTLAEPESEVHLPLPLIHHRATQSVDVAPIRLSIDFPAVVPTRRISLTDIFNLAEIYAHASDATRILIRAEIAKAVSAGRITPGDIAALMQTIPAHTATPFRSAKWAVRHIYAHAQQ